MAKKTSKSRPSLSALLRDVSALDVITSIALAGIAVTALVTIWNSRGAYAQQPPEPPLYDASCVCPPLAECNQQQCPSDHLSQGCFDCNQVLGSANCAGQVEALAASCGCYPAGSAPTATNTPVNTPTNTPVDTPTNTPVNTPTNTPVNTPTNTPVNTPTNTPVNTPTNTPVNTPTNTPVNTPTNTPKNTPTLAPTNTPTATPSHTPKSLGGGTSSGGSSSGGGWPLF